MDISDSRFHPRVISAIDLTTVGQEPQFNAVAPSGITSSFVSLNAGLHATTIQHDANFEIEQSDGAAIRDFWEFMPPATVTSNPCPDLQVVLRQGLHLMCSFRETLLEISLLVGCAMHP